MFHTKPSVASLLRTFSRYPTVRTNPITCSAALLAAAALSVACGENTAPSSSPPPPAVRVFRLISVNGRPLPTKQFQRYVPADSVVVDKGTLQLVGDSSGVAHFEWRFRAFGPNAPGLSLTLDGEPTKFDFAGNFARSGSGLDLTSLQYVRNTSFVRLGGFVSGRVSRDTIYLQKTASSNFNSTLQLILVQASGPTLR